MWGIKQRWRRAAMVAKVLTVFFVLVVVAFQRRLVGEGANEEMKTNAEKLGAHSAAFSFKYPQDIFHYIYLII